MADQYPALYSAITAFAYGCCIYAVGWNCGKKDGRKIPGFYPNPRLPLISSAWGVVIPVVLLILAVFFPDLWHTEIPFVNGEFEFFLTGNFVKGTTDMLFKIWYFAFESFLGNRRIPTYLLAILVQPTLMISGYFVGLTRFKLLDWMGHKILYQNDKSSDAK